MPFGATLTWSSAGFAAMCASCELRRYSVPTERGTLWDAAQSFSPAIRFIMAYRETRRRPSMSVRNLQHIALAVPDPAVGKKFYTDFGMEAKEDGKRVVMRCLGREQDQVVLVEGGKKQMHHVSFGTRAEDLEALKKRLAQNG